jgi:hypothetical protein
MKNYLDDTPNPYGLAAPPPHFLTDMETFDKELVLFPSQEEAVYRLGRKVKNAGDIWRLVRSLTHQTGEDGQSTKARPDSKTMAQHGLVPVTSILPSPLTHWGPTILQDLASVDVQRAGGADKFTDALEAREAEAEGRSDRTIRDDLDALARQAYSDIVWKTGRRVGFNLPESVFPPGRSEVGAFTVIDRRAHSQGADNGTLDRTHQ